MLKYIKLIFNSIKIIFYILFIILTSELNAKNVSAVYEITWNKIVLGNILWDFNLNSLKYEFTIELKSSGVSAKLYPFYGKHSSSGLVSNNKFQTKNYYQVWKTKKKNRFIEINFNNNKISSFEMRPHKKQKPKINFYKINSLTDPISAALQLIIINGSEIVSKVFDGRRIYNLSVVKKKTNKNYKIDDFENFSEYELKISNYQNIWKDHDNKDLKKVEITVGRINDVTLPVLFKIKNSGLVFKVNYLSHKIIN